MDKAMTAIRMPAAQSASSSDWTVAVTGVDTAQGAVVARCLRSAPGFRGRVLGLGWGDSESGIASDPGWDAGFAVPDPVAGASVLLDCIDRIRQEETVDAIIPCRDAELPNYITLQPALAHRGIRLMLPDRATLYSRNKDYLPTLCAKAGVSTPRVRRITHEGFFDLQGIDGQFWRYPMVVKGIFYDAYVVHTPEEAKQRFHQVAKVWGYPVLVQEFIAGEEVALAGLGEGCGAMTAMATIRKQGAICLPSDDPELRAAGQRLMAALKWRGPLEIEMLRDQAGKLHLIEINPRFPAWIDLAADVGPNLPAALLALMQAQEGVIQELVPPFWWKREAMAATRELSWIDEAWSLARFGNRGDHGMPAWSRDHFACPTT